MSRLSNSNSKKISTGAFRKRFFMSVFSFSFSLLIEFKFQTPRTRISRVRIVNYFVDFLIIPQVGPSCLHVFYCTSTQTCVSIFGEFKFQTPRSRISRVRIVNYVIDFLIIPQVGPSCLHVFLATCSLFFDLKHLDLGSAVFVL